MKAGRCDDLLVEEAAARPGERDYPAVLLHGHLHRPEPLGVNGGNRWDLALEVLDGVVAVHAEAQRGDLARTVADDGTVEIAVLVAEEGSLVPAEGHADLQVELLSRIHRVGLILVRVGQVGHRMENVRRRDGGVAGAVNSLLLYTSGMALVSTLPVLHNRFHT